MEYFGGQSCDIVLITLRVLWNFTVLRPETETNRKSWAISRTVLCLTLKVNSDTLDISTSTIAWKQHIICSPRNADRPIKSRMLTFNLSVEFTPWRTAQCQTATPTKQILISRKRCKIETWLLQTTIIGHDMRPMNWAIRGDLERSSRSFKFCV